MSKHNHGKHSAFAGNFTKAAIEEFEHNIVNQSNYLEKVEKERNSAKLQ